MNRRKAGQTESASRRFNVKSDVVSGAGALENPTVAPVRAGSRRITATRPGATVGRARARGEPAVTLSVTHIRRPWPAADRTTPDGRMQAGRGRRYAGHRPAASRLRQGTGWGSQRVRRSAFAVSSVRAGPERAAGAGLPRCRLLGCGFRMQAQSSSPLAGHSRLPAFHPGCGISIAVLGQAFPPGALPAGIRAILHVGAGSGRQRRLAPGAGPLFAFRIL
jgi:hypothetical protein